MISTPPLLTGRFAVRVAAVLLAAMAASAVPANAAPAGVRGPGWADLAAAEARLAELERDFELVVERYNLVREQYESAQGRRALAELQIRDLRAEVEGARAAAVGAAQELYKSGSLEGIEAVLSAASLGDLERRLGYMGASRRAQLRALAALGDTKGRLGGKVVELDASVAASARAQARLDELAGRIDGLMQEQRAEVAELTAAVERAERRARIERRRRARASARREAAERARELLARRLERQAAAREATGKTAPVAGAATAFEALGGNGAAADWDLPVTPGGVAVAAALSQIGKPYEWAADGPDTYDCSGLTMWAWGRAGVSLPHNSGMQYDATARVAQEDWQAGDLLFFGAPIHHVGMFIGDDKMVEAPYTGAFLRVESALRTDYAGAGRPGA